MFAVSKRWSAIKCKYNPGPLHSHSAVCVHSCMLIIGGEKSGNLSDEVWRFHFGTTKAAFLLTWSLHNYKIDGL